MDAYLSTDFLVAVGQIVLIDILLGGDNAVVIALACRKLAPAQRRLGILWGTAGAIVLRVVLIFFALTLLQVPYLKIVGGLLLLWIGVKLLQPEKEEVHGQIQASDRLWGAVKTVIVADFVMSLDNVIAIAGAAEGAGADNEIVLVVFGLLVSIPIIVWGSQFVIKLMERYPVVITGGAMLLGWIAGQMIADDPVLERWVDGHGGYVHYAASVAGAAFVLLVGRWLAGRAAARVAMPVPGLPAAPGGMDRVLLAVDGSDNSARAVQHLIALRQALRDGARLQVHLLNVHRPVPGEVSRFVPGDALKDYHDEGGERALAPARVLLDAAGVAYKEHRRIGEPVQLVADLARELDCDLVVMGSRGLGSATGALIGSVAQGVVARATVPVTLVK
jgi:YjbE family integral membrane protein